MAMRRRLPSGARELGVTNMKQAALPQWGEEVVLEEIGGIPFLVFAPRELMVANFWRYAERWSQRDYLVQGSRRLTFDEVISQVQRRSGRLISNDFTPGFRGLLLAWSSPEWIMEFWAILWAGGVPVLGNPLWSATEIDHAVQLVEPQLVLVDKSTAGQLPRGVNAEEIGTDLSQTMSLDNPISRHENDPAVVLFTSGTTGMPKAVVLPHRSVIAAIHGILAVTKRLPHQLSDNFRGEVVLQSLPLFHIGGVHMVARAALLGGTIVFPEGRFNGGEVLRTIEREQIESWSAVPTMAVRLLDEPSLATTNTSSLRSITLGGAPVHESLLKRLRFAFPTVRERVHSGWGLTEGGVLTVAPGAETLRHPGSVGKPLPYVQLRTDALDGTSEGELLARSPCQMLGYLGNLEDGDVLDSEGWLHTGDLGYIDGSGRVWLTGRKKHIIIRGGENIAPVHIEQVLLQHSTVLEVAVFGIPDAVFGECVAAAVVLRINDEESRAALKSFAAVELARFEVPSVWNFFDEPLPVNSVGKVDLNVLRASLLNPKGEDDDV